MDNIKEEGEAGAGPTNVTGGVENFSPMLFGPISRKPSDNKRKKNKKMKKNLREILEQSNSAERNEDRIKAAKSTLKTPEIPERNPRRQGAGRFARPEIKPKNDGAKAVEITTDLEAKRKNQGRVPDPKDSKRYGEFQNKFREATSKLGKPKESSSVNDAIRNSSMKNKDAKQRKNEMSK